MKGLLILNGDKSDLLPDENDYGMVVVADGAYEKSKEKIKNISCVVGDFDSLGYVPKNVGIMKLEPEKDYTDGEVGLLYLIEKGCDKVDIAWALGLRTDHFLGNLVLLKIAVDNGISARITSQNEDIYLIRDKIVLSGVLGKTISLLPFSETSHIIDGEGLKYKVNDLTLTKSETRGVSNVATEDTVKIDLGSGLLYVIVNKTER